MNRSHHGFLRRFAAPGRIGVINIDFVTRSRQFSHSNAVDVSAFQLVFIRVPYKESLICSTRPLAWSQDISVSFRCYFQVISMSSIYKRKEQCEQTN